MTSSYCSLSGDDLATACTAPRRRKSAHSRADMEIFSRPSNSGLGCKEKPLYDTYYGGISMVQGISQLPVLCLHPHLKQ
jgi:hypothetical protein